MCKYLVMSMVIFRIDMFTNTPIPVQSAADTDIGLFMHLNKLAYQHARPTSSGLIRSVPEDFIVNEQLSFELSGEGEHVCLWIEKRGENTLWLAKRLAELAGVKRRDIGYAGLKDRRAVTRQWFSVRLPLRQVVDWQRLDSGTVKVLDVSQHNKKIRQGSVKANQFKLVIRDVRGKSEDIERTLERLKTDGAPNYFGEQRFGINESNLDNAVAYFQRRIKPEKSLRALYISAARSMLFNQVLSRRILDDTWNTVLDGDVLMLNGSRSVFSSEGQDKNKLQQRVQDFDVSVTGPLFGLGDQLIDAQAKEIEDDVINGFTDLRDGLRAIAAQADRRALRFRPGHLKWVFESDVLSLSFELPTGCYATSLLRELLDVRQPND